MELNNNAAASSPISGAEQNATGAREASESGHKRGSVQSGHSSLSSGTSDSERLLSSNADYDHIRNTTLMFFLDRLFLASREGKETRTLHDLSCLFGTKEFTKEMRQIVGASRNGLKKFLQSYPSLFTIEGDKVFLTQLKEDSGASKTRDYNQEAVDYFTQKLLQFGASLVPIRNLFGYRSQASQEVRHVSGKNTAEFRQFLAAHDDVFEILADEHVVLKSVLLELQSRGESHLSLEQKLQDQTNLMDPYLNKQFAHLIESYMKSIKEDNKLTASSKQVAQQTDGSTSVAFDDRITLDYLHDKIMKDCGNQLFLKMVKTIEDLKVFLRMHPKLFKRFKSDLDGKEYVCLLSDEEKRELEIQAYPSNLTRQHSRLRRGDSNELDSNDISVGDQQPASLPNLQFAKQTHPRHLSTDQADPLTSSGSIQSNGNKSARRREDDGQSSVKRSLQTSRGQSALRANAPPFVPSTHISGPQSLQTTHTNHQATPTATRTNCKPDITIQRSVSNLNQGTVGHREPLDPHQALRSYLIKASVGNSSQGLYSPSKQSNGAYVQPLSRQASNGNNDDLRARTINIVREASNIVTRIMTTTDAVAFDCKGYNLGFNGQITLIQFAFLPKSNQNLTSRPLFDKNQQSNSDSYQINGKQKPEVCIFDLITNPELAYCLKPLLESEQIVKIVHDVRNKSNALHVQFGIILNHVFDTQVANLVIQQQETCKPAYKSRYISISRLCELYGDEHLTKYRALIKSRTRHSNGGPIQSQGKTKDVNYWRQRPLTEAMVYESTMDVYCLVGGIYQNLKSKIRPEYQPLFDQLNLEGVLARIKPDEIRSVKKERKIDLEVIDLKRKLYTDTRSPIVLSNREIRLLRHINLTEEVREKIQQCKKVAKKLERLDMKAAQNSQTPPTPNNRISTDEDQSSVDQTDGSSLSLSLPVGCNEGGQVFANSCELGETGMTDLMDSSMFDELKDKMIESSSLLESLEEDDDDVGTNQPNHGHANFSGNCDKCRCNCHRGSSEAADKADSPSMLSMSNSATCKDDAICESRAVDMAVQCDLLS